MRSETDETRATSPAAGAYARRHPFTFLAQDCPRTLREGMAEFAAAQPELLTPADPEAARFIAAHDACHVLFGLTTALDDEVLADVWTMLATDLPARRYVAYARHPELAPMFVATGAWRLALATARNLPRLVRVAWRARRMPARWPFWAYAEHLDAPLAGLRRRFGVRVV